MAQKLASQSRISFLESGKPTPNCPNLLFLHAFPLSNEMWRNQLAEFGPHFRCLAPNFFGSGQTARLPTLSFFQFSVQLSHFLREVEAEKVIVIGLSMGGYAALELWRQCRDRIAGLMLCDTRADADDQNAKKSRDEMHAFALQNDARALVRKMTPKLLGETTRVQKPEILEKIESLAAAHDSKILADAILALKNRRDSTDLLPQISVPTLVLGGAEDEISTPQIMAEMAAQIPNSRHVVIEGAGHLCNLEQPEKFNAALREWLGDDETTIWARVLAEEQIVRARQTHLFCARFVATDGKP